MLRIHNYLSTVNIYLTKSTNQPNQQTINLNNFITECNLEFSDSKIPAHTLIRVYEWQMQARS